MSAMLHGWLSQVVDIYPGPLSPLKPCMGAGLSLQTWECGLSEEWWLRAFLFLLPILLSRLLRSCLVPCKLFMSSNTSSLGTLTWQCPFSRYTL